MTWSGGRVGGGSCGCRLRRWPGLRCGSGATPRWGRWTAWWPWPDTPRRCWPTRDGTARLLDIAADLLVGLDPATPRTDHQAVLEPGSTVLLCTDGLVERRHAGLDDGLSWLIQAATDLADLRPDQLCDTLLEQVSDDAEDDIALLALRVAASGRRWVKDPPGRG